MKTCPFCAAENPDDAQSCYNCGLDLRNLPPNAPPTQPVRVPPQAGQTQPGYIPPVGNYPRADATEPYQPYRPQTPPSYSDYPSSGGYPPQSAGYRQTYPPYMEPVEPEKTLQSEFKRLWPLWVGGGVVFLIACLLAIFTVSNVLGKRPASQPPTGAEATPTAAPTVAPIFEAPSPWPTFTPAPEPTEAPPVIFPTPVDNGNGNPPNGTLPTPAPTAGIDWSKYLTPQCAAAVEEVGRARDQLTSQPTILFESGWRERFNQATSDLRASCGTLETASPVPGLVEQARQDLADASNEYNQASQAFDQGFKKFNPGQIIQGFQHLGRATSALNSAIKTLGEIGK